MRKPVIPYGAPSAPTELQWSLTLSSEETCRLARRELRRVSFNGASLFRVRKLTYYPELSENAVSFNGASLFRVRKRPNVLDETVRNTALQWSLTLSSEETGSNGYTDRSQWRFNGASLFRVRKRRRIFANFCGFSSFNGASLFRVRKLGRHRGNGVWQQV